VVSAVTGSPAAASAPLLLEILDAELRRTDQNTTTPMTAASTAPAA
jgi:hypothetical protein